MFTSTSAVFKLLVWLVCVCAVVLVSQVQCRTLAGNALPAPLRRGPHLTRIYGLEDNVSNRKRRDAPDQGIDPQDQRWPAGSNLTYRVGRGPSHGVLKDADIAGLVRLAFREWAPHCGLHFTQIHSGMPNISVFFLNQKADGPGGLLALTPEFPSKERHNLEVFFDDEEEWVLFKKPGSYEFYRNLLHELGHALGLLHSDNYSSIMYGFYNLDSSSTLQNEDISRMRKLYGIPGNYSGSIFDEVPYDGANSYKTQLFNYFTADVNKRKKTIDNLREFLRHNNNTTEVYFYKHSSTESSEEPSSSINTTVKYKYSVPTQLLKEIYDIIKN